MQSLVPLAAPSGHPENSPPAATDAIPVIPEVAATARSYPRPIPSVDIGLPLDPRRPWQVGYAASVTHMAACPHCATAIELPLACDRCGWRWYANPMPAAGVLIERPGPDGEPTILLLRRAVEPGIGEWDLPAGYLEPHESMEDGARREAREESGIEVELVELVGVYSTPLGNAVAAVYRAVARDPAQPVAMDAESSAFAWVGRAELPGWMPRMAFDSMRVAVQDWADGKRGIPHTW